MGSRHPRNLLNKRHPVLQKGVQLVLSQEQMRLCELFRLDQEARREEDMTRQMKAYEEQERMSEQFRLEQERRMEDDMKRRMLMQKLREDPIVRICIGALFFTFPFF